MIAALLAASITYIVGEAVIGETNAALCAAAIVFFVVFPTKKKG